MLFIRAGYGSEVQGQGEGEQKVKKVQISYFLATGIKGCDEQTDLVENTCLQGSHQLFFLSAFLFPDEGWEPFGILHYSEIRLGCQSTPNPHFPTANPQHPLRPRLSGRAVDVP